MITYRMVIAFFFLFLLLVNFRRSGSSFTSNKFSFSVFAHLVAAAKEIGLEVNADKTKYMVVSRDQRVG